MSDQTSDAHRPESRWPTDRDRLFVETAWACDAHVVREPAERHYRLPMGYKRAGDILIHQAAADVVDRRNIIYPALFCYRQSIELFLKALIDEFGQKTAPLRHTHDLNCLWEEFMRIVSRHSAADPGGLDAARNLVAEMQSADERSDGFRFATDRNGAAFAFGDRAVDLANLRRVMEGLVNFFECAHLDLSNRERSDEA